MAEPGESGHLARIIKSPLPLGKWGAMYSRPDTAPLSGLPSCHRVWQLTARFLDAGNARHRSPRSDSTPNLLWRRSTVSRHLLFDSITDHRGGTR